MQSICTRLAEYKFNVISSNIGFKKAFGSLEDRQATKYLMFVNSGIDENKI